MIRSPSSGRPCPLTLICCLAWFATLSPAYAQSGSPDSSGLATEPTTAARQAEPAASSAKAKTKAKQGPNIDPSEIKPGMRGITRTVMQGTEIVDLETEILGVEKGGLGPGYDLIIGKLVDERTQKTGAVHGMSGSPLFIIMPDGTERLAGALSRRIAFFEKDGHCGFTPIKDMLLVDDKLRASKESASTRNYQPSRRANFSSNTAIAQNKPSDQQAAGSEHLGLPLTVSGVAPEIWSRLAPRLEFENLGLIPVRGGGESTSAQSTLGPELLQPGAAVAAVLMTGDITVAGTGTLTWRDGDRILGFGHPMMGIGETRFGMGTAEIVTTIPSYSVPYKLSNLGQVVGTVSQDRWSAIGGRVGDMPLMVPYRVERHHHGQQRATFTGKFTPIPEFSARLMMIATSSALTHDDISQDLTLKLTGTLKLKDHAEVIQLSGFGSGSGFGAAFRALSDAFFPVLAVYNQNFEKPSAEAFDIKIESFEIERQIRIESITIGRETIKPGQPIEVVIELLPKYGERRYERVSVMMPESLRSGAVTVRVADGRTLDRERRSRIAAARSLEEIISSLNRRREADRIYVQLATAANGQIVEQRELPILPDTVLAVMDGGNTTAESADLNEIVWLETSIETSGYDVSGSQRLNLTIE